MWRKFAAKLKGWNTIDDISKKLKIKKSTSYFYVYKLAQHGFIIQKVKRPRGTMYLFSPIPSKYKHYGIYENSSIISPELELTKKHVRAEQKIPFFLSKYKKEKNTRYYEEAKNNIRKIKNWKMLYRFIKAYDVSKEFKQLYKDSRKTIKKIPRMPKRYKRLIGD